MMSNDEMIQNVFRRTDEYFERRKKRIAYIEKGVAFMSITGILVALGICTSLGSSVAPALPEEPNEIDLNSGIGVVTTQTLQTSESAVTSTGSVNTTAETTSAVTEGVTSTAVASSAAVRTILTSADTSAETAATAASVSATNEAVTSTSAAMTTSVIFDIEETKKYGIFKYAVRSDGIVITGCSDKSVVSMEIPSEIENLPVIEIGGFTYCSELTEVIIPDTVETIEDGAFKDCTALTSVNIPDGIVTIGNLAFYGCSSLDGINIPESVVYIGATAFCECSSLSGINVDAENEQYTCDNGVLFNKDMTCLIWYPECRTDTEYVIPDGVQLILDHSFYGCSALKSVHISDSVTHIGTEAFAYCEGLTSIETGGVTVVEKMAFGYCTNLTSAVFQNGNMFLIDDRAFIDCNNMTSVTIEDPECYIADSADTIYRSAVIYGYADSTAQSYAEKYGREFVALDDMSAEKTGDADDNGTVDLSDAVEVLAIYAQNASGLNSAIYRNSIDNAADVNSDGSIDLDDAAAIITYYVQTAAGLNPSWDEIIS